MDEGKLLRAMQKEIKVNDTVRLKGSSQIMVIREIHNIDSYFCDWIDHTGKHYSVLFHEKVLVPVEVSNE